MIKKIFINFLIISIIFLLFDFLFYNFLNHKFLNKKFKLDFPRYKNSLKIINFDNEYEKLKNEKYFRNALNAPNSSVNNKKPILIFGCSFTYGFVLDEKQAFAYKLHKLTGRNVYNQSISSLGIQYFPYILEKFEIEKDVRVPYSPEYIIFVFIDNHIYRLYRYFFSETEPYKDIRYKLKNNKLVQINDRIFFLQRFVTYRYLCNLLSRIKYNRKSFDEKFDFMKAHFLYAKKIAEKKFPNAKLVILRFEEVKNSDIFYSDRWSELEKEGFIVLDTYSLTGKHLCNEEYRIKNDIHPNEHAWDILTPKIIEKLNL